MEEFEKTYFVEKPFSVARGNALKSQFYKALEEKGYKIVPVNRARGNMCDAIVDSRGIIMGHINDDNLKIKVHLSVRSKESKELDTILAEWNPEEKGE